MKSIVRTQLYANGFIHRMLYLNSAQNSRFKILFVYVIISVAERKQFNTETQKKIYDQLVRCDVFGRDLLYFSFKVTEKEIRQWHKGFLKDCPNGLLTEQVLIVILLLTYIKLSFLF